MTVINHDMNYVGWVQRSLNRITGAGLRTDGQISKLYRMWVMEFQYGSSCGTRDGSVDRITQDAIIRNNLCGSTKGSVVYVQWVQQALGIAGSFANVLPTGILDKPTKDAIRKFQISVNHKHIDGIVGPKTELDLIRKVPNLVVPGFYPGHSIPMPDPVADRLDDTLDQHNDVRGIDQRIDNWTNMLLERLTTSPGRIADPVRREGTKCMIRKIQFGHYDYEYLTKENAFKVAQGHGEKGKTKEELDLPYDLPDSEYKVDLPVSKFTLNARNQLRYKVGKFSNHMESKSLFKHYEKAVEELYREIDEGIKQVKYQIHNSGIKAGSYKKLEEWYDSKIGNSNSIISCFLDPSGNPWLGGRTGY